jgi:hypothetical protein
MVQYRAISKTIPVAKLEETFNQNAREIKRGVMESIAEVIAQTSPVDTGTYARNHTVSIRSGSAQANIKIPEGAPRRVPAGPPRGEGLARMLAEINTDRILDSDNVVFRNDTTHAVYVEQMDQIYSRARNEVNNMVKDTLAKLGMKSG